MSKNATGVPTPDATTDNQPNPCLTIPREGSARQNQFSSVSLPEACWSASAAASG